MCSWWRHAQETSPVFYLQRLVRMFVLKSFGDMRPYVRDARMTSNRVNKCWRCCNIVDLGLYGTYVQYILISTKLIYMKSSFLCYDDSDNQQMNPCNMSCIIHITRQKRNNFQVKWSADYIQSITLTLRLFF